MTVLDQFQALNVNNAFTVSVFYRGDWCPWCTAYLTDLNGEFLQRIRARGGDVVAITSQRNPQAKQQHNLDFAVLADPENQLAKAFNVFLTPKAETPFAEGDEYLQGMAQPAVIVRDSQGNTLYEWIIVPSEMNMGGAADRPLVADIAAAIEAKLDGKNPPKASKGTDMDYLQANHPAQYKLVQDYLASLAG